MPAKKQATSEAVAAPQELTPLRFYEAWERILHKHLADLERMQAVFREEGFEVPLMDLQYGWQEYSAEQLMDWMPLPDDVLLFDILYSKLGAAD